MERKIYFYCCKKEQITTNKSPARHERIPHLSLVVLYVEEFCVAGQVDHCFDVVFGLVDDGQVE